MAGVTDAQIAKLTVRYLSIRALANRDSMAWARVHGMRLKGEQFKLQKRRMALQDRFLSLRDRRVELLERAEARKQAKAANTRVNSTMPREPQIDNQHSTHCPTTGCEAEKQKCAGTFDPSNHPRLPFTPPRTKTQTPRRGNGLHTSAALLVSTSQRGTKNLNAIIRYLPLKQ